jgi:hypothetical protein
LAVGQFWFFIYGLSVGVGAHGLQGFENVLLKAFVIYRLFLT